jgi:NADH:ubiquinone oxidoreductase subunit 6 (subunit J)
LHSYCETVHLRAHVLQKFISGMNPLAKVFIDFQLISDNISERWLIPIEILAITTLLAVVEGEIGLISS